MSVSSSVLVRKLWQYCNVLRDDGLSYPDYVEQLTYLLFLKLSDEQVDGPVPPEYSWSSFANLDAEEMHRHYAQVLSMLGRESGMLGLIFRNSRNKIRDPAKLRLLMVDLIGQTEWSGLSADVKGDAYEGLLEKNARDTKSGAGQYFTPRPLIEAVVACVNPRPGEVICDPACGTGGFLLASFDHLIRTGGSLSPEQKKHIATSAIRGVELVEEVARLASMNLLLHGVGGTEPHEFPVSCEDSLREPPKCHADVVLTNPPFGVKGSVKYAPRAAQQGSDDLTTVRPDFWVPTANKQLNFIQHVYTILKPGGRAAVVVPDNVLFESGAAAIVRRRLLETCELHTLLRLPAGLFYAQGVAANVLFFDRARSAMGLVGGRLWVYDLREGNRFTLRTNPIQSSDLADFVASFRSGQRSDRVSEGSARWRAFDVARLLHSDDCSLDLSWSTEQPQDGSGALGRLDEMTRLISEDLKRALELIANTR